MTAVIEGPGWSARGLDQRSGRCSLAVEGPVLQAVDRLAPGVSTTTRFARYYAMYAALAAHAGRHGLDAEACRTLVRRCEAVMAGVSLLLDEPSLAHGVDRVRPRLGDDLDVAGAAEDHSPRPWGFWEQYGGPGAVLGTVALEDGALRPGRHSCPAPVRDLFAPLIEAASHDRLTWDQIEALEPLALLSQEPPEGPWLRDLFTATRNGSHDPDAWEATDRRRRGALRMVGRAAVLDGRSDEDTVRSVVAFGNRAATDPVLGTVPDVMSWRGVLLRHYSVGAWRRLWAGLVATISDSGPQELRDRLADQMPDQSVRALLDELPATMVGGHPAPIERAVLAVGDAHDPLTNVRLLLLGGRRSGELDGVTGAAFLGPRTVLNPEWVRLRAEDLADRPMRDLAAGLVDDMLAQSRRVALATMVPDGGGGSRVYSRVHERNGRYYRTGEESAEDLGLRLGRLAELALQLGLLDRAGDDGGTTVSPLGARLLEVGA
ncbi:hypothetical protein ACFVH6_03660 [Spirillospora sp. NPDC127200]